MYIKEVRIDNIRSIKEFHMSLPQDQLAGWHVLIGDNGSGKSTILQAIALGFLGQDNALSLRLNWNELVNSQAEEGLIWIDIAEDTLQGQLSFFYTPDIKIHIQRDELYGKFNTENWEKWERGTGRFSVGFGPFRRFAGGSQAYKSPLRKNPRLFAHLSLFGEDIALTESLDWLVELNYKQLENRKEGKILNPIRQFINQEGFLPHDVQLESISSEGVVFKDANGVEIPVENLSDGYRSVLCMIFELIRQLQIAYPDTPIFSKSGKQIKLPGVVLIDEVDSHLHPSWQRQIGQMFLKYFPNMQFIVTTHSPLVCQAAAHGTIWRLPSPSSQLESYQVKPDSEEWKRLVYGNVLEAYSTDLFGENIDRSPEAQAKYDRVAELSAKELDEPLSASEEKELNRLMEELPSTPYKRTLGAAGHD